MRILHCEKKHEMFLSENWGFGQVTFWILAQIFGWLRMLWQNLTYRDLVWSVLTLDFGQGKLNDVTQGDMQWYEVICSDTKVIWSDTKVIWSDTRVMWRWYKSDQSDMYLAKHWTCTIQQTRHTCTCNTGYHSRGTHRCNMNTLLVFLTRYSQITWIQCTWKRKNTIHKWKQCNQESVYGLSHL